MINSKKVYLAAALLLCSNAFALGTDANFEPDPAAVKAAEETQTIKAKDNSKKQETLPNRDKVEKGKTPAEKMKPSDIQKSKEANEGSSAPSSGQPQTPQKSADEYIRGY